MVPNLHKNGDFVAEINWCTSKFISRSWQGAFSDRNKKTFKNQTILESGKVLEKFY